MKVSDYIAEFLAQRGVTHAFGMSGGAAVHLFDSIDRHPAMTIVSMTHEQCAAMAADGYARTSGRLGVAVSTSGPGATNLLTGTCCSFYDSIPTLMLTGQVATHRLKGQRLIRQMGFQETDVVSIFKSVTKYAVQVEDALSIRYHLERAHYLAVEGRPGPVLIDIPDDLQRVEIEPQALAGFSESGLLVSPAPETLLESVGVLLARLRAAKRPVVILGGGLKTPPVGNVLLECVDRLGVPVLVSWAGVDLLPADHPLRVGTFGVYGPRAGNFTAQNADLVVAIGTRLSQNLTGGILSSFAREATIVMVDVDEHEMAKFDGRGLTVHQRIHSRATEFLVALRSALPDDFSLDLREWKQQISHWRTFFRRDVSPGSTTPGSYLDAYDFVDALSEALPDSALIFADTGGNLTWTCNGLRPKSRQRVHSAWNNTPMGYALPASIGGAFFDKSQPVTCIIGDGGLMLALGELATVAKHRLPIRIFLFNNHGHGIQKQTLETWLGGRYLCVDPDSGLAFPTDFVRVAQALGLSAETLDGSQPLRESLARICATEGPIFVNVEINPQQKLYPVVKYGFPLEDQLPQLDKELLDREMLVAPFGGGGPNANTRKQGGQGW